MCTQACELSANISCAVSIDDSLSDNHLPIVVWTVALGMIGRSNGAHLVTVYGVVEEESFHFISYLLWG